MKEYVVGFLFNISETRVVLIEKKRPAWQAGKLNGVGGKIESGESPFAAMRREFREETGVTIQTWHCVLILSDYNWRVHFFRTFGKPERAQTTTDEEIGAYCVNSLPDNVIPNLRWIIPMCLDRGLNLPVVVNSVLPGEG